MATLRENVYSNYCHATSGIDGQWVWDQIHQVAAPSNEARFAVPLSHHFLCFAFANLILLLVACICNSVTSWSITKAIEKRIDAFDQWCLRRIYPEHYLVGVCNEFRSPSAYWSATAIRHCANQTPEVVWPRGPGRHISRSFPCSTSLHIACPKELEAASRSPKTYLAKDGGGRSAPI